MPEEAGIIGKEEGILTGNPLNNLDSNEGFNINEEERKK